MSDLILKNEHLFEEYALLKYKLRRSKDKEKLVKRVLELENKLALLVNSNES